MSSLWAVRGRPSGCEEFGRPSSSCTARVPASSVLINSSVSAGCSSAKAPAAQAASPSNPPSSWVAAFPAAEGGGAVNGAKAGKSNTSRWSRAGLVPSAGVESFVMFSASVTAASRLDDEAVAALIRLRIGIRMKVEFNRTRRKGGVWGQQKRCPRTCRVVERGYGRQRRRQKVTYPFFTD